MQLKSYIHRYRYLTGLYLLFFFISCHPEKYYPPPSGYYGNHLILAHEPGGNIITGMYVKDLKDSIPDPACSFYFTAKYVGQKSNTIRWLPGQRDNNDLFGYLKMLEDNSFIFYWEKNMEGCPGTPKFTTKQIKFALTQAEPWQFIRTVRTENAVVHADPDQSSPAVGYVQQDVIVKVLDRRGIWLKVVAGRNNQITGWVNNRLLKRFPS